MTRFLSRDKLIVALTLLVALLPVVLASLYVANKHQWAQDRLAELEPRYARLLGLESSRNDLKEVESAAAKLLVRHAYPAAQDVSQSGNDAQQRIRNIFTSAGLEVVSSQVLAPKVEKNFDRIPLVVRLEGELLALQSALAVLSTQTPTILVDGFSVQTIGAVKADAPQRLAAQFNLAVLRVRP